MKYVNAAISILQYIRIWACETHAETNVNIYCTGLDTVGENYSQTTLPGGDIPPICTPYGRNVELLYLRYSLCRRISNVKIA